SPPAAVELSLDGLADDLLLAILEHMHAADLCAMSLASRRFHELAQEPALWQVLMSRVLTSNSWTAQPEQVADDRALRRLLLCEEWQAPRAVFPNVNVTRALSVSANGFKIKYTGERLGGDRAIRVQPPLPTTPHDFLLAENHCSGMRYTVKPKCTVAYFETFIGPGLTGFPQSDCVAIGLASSDFPLHGRQPGWDSHSFGYHSDDGRLFHGSGTRTRAAWPCFKSGDVVGCGVSLITLQIFYTLNGHFLGVPFKASKCHLPLYPVVGIDSHVEISLNLGQQPFMFNLDLLPVSLSETSPKRKASPLRQIVPAFGRDKLVSVHL
ncbi:MAG: hypothetical protein SGPRY_012176, partial [Prymnesium sp.]